jgi:thiamine biosynthesis lipoprotein
MRRRVFVTGSLLAAAAAGTYAWLPRLGRSGSHARRRPWAQTLPDGRVLVRDAALAFGTSVSIAAVHQNPDVAQAAIEEALNQTRRIDALMTVYRPDSQVGRLNVFGEIVDPDPHLVRVLEFSQRLAALSDGAFDVTVQPLWKLFAASKRTGSLPSREAVAAARSLVDWSALLVSPQRIVLKRPGMSITLNGVAQGYAADLALEALRERGIQDALIDTGEFGADGARAAGQPWTIGLRHPRDPDGLIGAIAMDGRFVATSGDYATPFSDDFIYHHIFDPRTGYSPLKLSSVAVAARSGMAADGLTKPTMVLERSRAEALLSRYPGAGAVWIDKDSRIVATRDLQLVAAG